MIDYYVFLKEKRSIETKIQLWSFWGGGGTDRLSHFI